MTYLIECLYCGYKYKALYKPTFCYQCKDEHLKIRDNKKNNIFGYPEDDVKKDEEDDEWTGL